MRPLRLLRGAVSAGMVAVVVIAAPAVTQSNAAEIGLGTSLVGSDSGVLAVDVAPGQTLTHRMRVRNGTSQARAIRLYSGAAWSENGTLVDDSAGGMNALSQWIVVGVDQADLAAGETAEVDFTIAVPVDAPDAELHAVVWADTGAARSGVRVRLDVAGGNGPAPRFSVSRLKPARLADGSFLIEVVARSAGPRAAAMSGGVRLIDGPGNRWIPEQPAQSTVLQPGTSASIPVPMGAGVGLPSGPWTARGYVHNGYQRVRIDETVTFPDAPTPEPAGSTSGSLGSLGSLGSPL